MGKCFEELSDAEQEFVLRTYIGRYVQTTDEVEGMEIPDGTDEVFKDLIWEKIKKFQKTLDKVVPACYTIIKEREHSYGGEAEANKVSPPLDSSQKGKRGFNLFFLLHEKDC